MRFQELPRSKLAIPLDAKCYLSTIFIAVMTVGQAPQLDTNEAMLDR